MKKFTLFTSILLMFSVFVAKSQSIVVTTPQFKNVVLEEFTGIHCQYCPEGHAIAQALLDSNLNKVVLVNVHQGVYAVPSGSEPDFRTSFGDALATNSNVGGYPAGTVNRHIFPNIDPVMAMGRGGWTTAAAEVMTQQSPVNVGFNSSYNSGTGELTVNVELYYTQNSAVTENYIQVAFLENHLIGFQQYTSGTYPAYDHKHVLRHFLTGQWGDIVSTTTQGTLVQRTYVYTVPATYNNTNCTVANCDVAVYVSEGHSEIYTGGVAPVGNTFDGNSNLFTGNYNAPVNDVVAGSIGNLTSIPFSAFNALNGTEDFTFTLTTDAPGNWVGGFNINGTDYTSSATVSIINGTPANINLNVTPGNTPAVAKYTLTMTSVSNPTATSHVIELYVVSGVTDLVVNGGGSWGDGLSYNWQSVYTDGLTFANNTSFAAVSADVFQKAQVNNALTSVGHIYFNVGWTFPSFSDAVATSLMAFMDNGGNVMICGQDIAWDIKSGSGYGTTITSNLFTNYMHSLYVADGGATNNSLNPDVADPLFGAVGISPVVDVYAGNFYPDQINVTTGSVALFKYSTSTRIAGLRYNNATYKMVYVAPGMEQLSDLAVRNNIIKQAHDWFHGLISNVSIIAKSTDVIVYPNPTSDKLFIDTYVYDASKLSIQITDLSGKTVLVDNKIVSNQPINISNLESGFYFVKVNGIDGSSVHKIQVIR